MDAIWRFNRSGGGGLCDLVASKALYTLAIKTRMVPAVLTRVLNGPTGQVSEVGPLGQSKWMSETGLD